MPLPLGQGTGQATEKQQPLCCCQLLHRSLTETSLFLDSLGTLTSLVLLWLALYNDLKSFLQAQGGPTALLCGSSGAHATELSYQRQFLIRALLSGSKAIFTLE